MGRLHNPSLFIIIMAIIITIIMDDLTEDNTEECATGRELSATGRELRTAVLNRFVMMFCVGRRIEECHALKVH